MSRGPSKAVAALRSATELAIPGLKREGGESQPLMSIPRMKSDCGMLGSARPGSLSRTSSTAGEESRQGKKTGVDAELQDAISALRRPNRNLAGASMVEAAEKRVSGGGGLSQIRSKFGVPRRAYTGMQGLTIWQKRISPFAYLSRIASRSRRHRCTTGTATPRRLSHSRPSHSPSQGLVPASRPLRPTPRSYPTRRRGRASGTPYTTRRPRLTTPSSPRLRGPRRPTGSRRRPYKGPPSARRRSGSGRDLRRRWIRWMRYPGPRR